MTVAEKPVLHCLVALELREGVFTDPARVSLELALEFKRKGYMVVGPDPDDEQDLATWERANPWYLKMGGLGL